MRYDRARVSLDRHATYIVATFLAGASRRHHLPALAREIAPEAICAPERSATDPLLGAHGQTFWRVFGVGAPGRSAKT
jgi:hypothetical protein